MASLIPASHPKHCVHCCYAILATEDTNHDDSGSLAKSILSKIAKLRKLSNACGWAQILQLQCINGVAQQLTCYIGRLH